MARRPKPPDQRPDMTPRMARFVAEYLRTSDSKGAAIAAGYAPKSASNRAWELLHRNPAVMAAVKDNRDKIAEKAVYDTVVAMRELEIGMSVALQTKQMMAYVRAAELRARLMGVLRDRMDLNITEKIDISGTLMDARKRAMITMAPTDPVAIPVTEYVRIQNPFDKP